MGRFRRGVLGFFGGLVAGAVLTLALCIAAALLLDIPSFEGAYAMGVAFFWVPRGAVVGGVAGAVWSGTR